MQTNIPKTSEALSALMRADFTTQWRNRKSFMLILLVPVVILVSWQGIINKIGAAFAFSTCITIGLMAIGLMGYSNSIARDREKGVFQRLRVSPVPSWTIMVSRLSVQLAMILLLTILVFIAGFYVDHVSITPAGYALAFLAAIAGGAVYLGLGQVIVGLIKNPETVNSTTRLVYFLFIMVGMFSDFSALDEQASGTVKLVNNIVKWSPYGCVKRILLASMEPGTWNMDCTNALLLTFGYAVLLSAIGIRKFKWSTK
ncbi:ABC transporter permease [Deminuibacter soli]|uniref:ABC transporter permease n=1 Tax=Deminuibacter soli TaxID=2291815 RepID=A0A3E1NNY2_9BACT|nr:ABC transporter permease [Deminuibacter soli]RFM29534.1 ABC transporter permease [Deminuibacter soli]